MASFDDREKGYEGKFAHDQEIAFKARARRDSLLARWVASRLKLSPAETEEYRKSLTEHVHEKSHDDDLVRRILADCAAKNVDMTERRLRKHIEELLEDAHQQITEETKG